MQDSTGMKLWKKRWFVLSDLCLFYYRGECIECLAAILIAAEHGACPERKDVSAVTVHSEQGTPGKPLFADPRLRIL